MKYNNFLSRAVRREKPTMSEVIGDLHHGVIWLLLRTSYVLPESFTFSFSYANWGICYLNPTGLQSLNNREKTKESPQVVVKWRQCANTIGLHCFPNFLLGKSALHFSPFSSRLCCFRQRLHRWTVKKQSDEIDARNPASYAQTEKDIMLFSSVYPFIVFIKSHLIGMFRILVSSCIWRLTDSTMSAKDKTKTKINKQNQT